MIIISAYSSEGYAAKGKESACRFSHRSALIRSWYHNWLFHRGIRKIEHSHGIHFWATRQLHISTKQFSHLFVHLISKTMKARLRYSVKMLHHIYDLLFLTCYCFEHELNIFWNTYLGSKSAEAACKKLKAFFSKSNLHNIPNEHMRLYQRQNFFSNSLITLILAANSHDFRSGSKFIMQVGWLKKLSLCQMRLLFHIILGV